MAPLGYLLAFLIVLMLAASVSQLAKHLPNAGGYYTYISHTLHPRLGWISGWIMFLYMPVAPFTSPVFLSFLLRDELKASNLGWDIPWWLIFILSRGWSSSSCTAASRSRPRRSSSSASPRS